MVETVSVGIPGLDEALLKGLPKGYSLMVSGEPGSGTELFAKQFAAAGIGKENVLYITTTERTEDIINTMHEFGWKSDMQIVNIGTMYYEEILAKELEISKYRQEGIGVNDVKNITLDESKMRTTNFLTLANYKVSRLKSPFRIVIDTIDFFMEIYDRTDVVSTLRLIKAHSQHHGGVLCMTMLKDVYDRATQSALEEIADCVVELQKQQVQMETKLMLAVKKVRNHPEKGDILQLEIGENGFIARPLK